VTTLSDKQSPLMLIVAGVNGAGKSTLYEVHSELFSNTGAVPQDPIAQEVTYAESTGQATSQPETFPAGNYEPLDELK